MARRNRGRRQPYTEIGIRRILCSHCRQHPSQQQWRVCANGNLYLGLCPDCDFKLNYLVLKFMGWNPRELKIIMNEYTAILNRGKDGTAK